MASESEDFAVDESWLTVRAGADAVAIGSVVTGLVSRSTEPSFVVPSLCSTLMDDWVAVLASRGGS
jgi:hypothetical protein